MSKLIDSVSSGLQAELEATLRDIDTGNLQAYARIVRVLAQLVCHRRGKREDTRGGRRTAAHERARVEPRRRRWAGGREEGRGYVDVAGPDGADTAPHREVPPSYPINTPSNGEPTTHFEKGNAVRVSDALSSEAEQMYTAARLHKTAGTAGHPGRYQVSGVGPYTPQWAASQPPRPPAEQSALYANYGYGTQNGRGNNSSSSRFSNIIHPHN
ncbi:hypothetical protein HYPSUDRAFT_1090270 [Hypholoma sublateritium FD-334 SS-4]|uniref:Uncharacterized protein n=1 Tax=Hypholoma sublateritium (strain FD-334 SS-4) TaxID=945553 RepID=A0A0D2NW02_HYPSF|nr:hypothetical protein HYPSUDRAFT_1090270 [Hypholoma sublateritium FD-334 SS-4]